MSDTFSRRYTPPTCTLEINAQTSALSRWSRQPVLKQLQFYLSFDNLLGSDNQPTQISGDRAQLDALCDAVESYVQARLNYLIDQPTAPPESPGVAAQPDRFELFPFKDGTGRTSTSAIMPESSAQGIYLQPKGQLSHSLFLGSLMTEASGSVITLSTSQLFDLASALEEYAAESVPLPQPERTSPVTWIRGTPLWAQTAAIAVVTVGITTAALQLTSNNPISQNPSTGEPRIASPPPPGADKLPATPPPPPPGSTPLPSDLTTVPLPSTLPNPSDLPSIQPPPDGATSSSNSKSESNSAAKQTAKPSAIPSSGNQIITLQPKNYPTASQTTAARKAAEKSQTSGTSDSIYGTTSTSVPSSQSSQLKESAFNSIPQIAEVRTYFKKTWLPPKGLKQSLQYTLILNPNGSIDRALPRGQAADTYLDRTPIPLANEPFFTPIKSGDRPKVRLVLSPDGSVKTFLESSN